MTFATACLLSAFAAAPPADTRTIRETLLLLGSDDYEEREVATRWLTARPDSVAALEGQRHHVDLEVRRRVGRILAAIRTNDMSRIQRRIRRFIQSGRVDLATASLVQHGGLWPEAEARLDLERLLTRAYWAEMRNVKRPPPDWGFDELFPGLVPFHGTTFYHTAGTHTCGQDRGLEVAFARDIVTANPIRCIYFSMNSFRSTDPIQRNLVSVAVGPAALSDSMGSAIIGGGGVAVEGGAVRGTGRRPRSRSLS